MRYPLTSKKIRPLRYHRVGFQRVYGDCDDHPSGYYHDGVLRGGDGGDGLMGGGDWSHAVSVSVHEREREREETEREREREGGGRERREREREMHMINHNLDDAH